MTSDEPRDVDAGRKPSEQRGGSTPGEEEAERKGPWAAKAAYGVVPAELGGSDASGEMLGDDPELGSEVLGETTGSPEPATRDGIDPSEGDHADATRDGGPDVPGDVEPDLRDAAATQLRRGAEEAPD
ncbi:MAG TPA: hypothetical protein VFQ71_08240 [Gaiellales bacterium]|nr:hypothetical protein [Gaiellales bacterium]